MSGIGNKHLAREVMQKSTSAEIGFLMIVGSDFVIWSGVGASFHDFICQETGLKSDDFSE